MSDELDELGRAKKKILETVDLDISGSTGSLENTSCVMGDTRLEFIYIIDIDMLQRQIVWIYILASISLIVHFPSLRRDVSGSEAILMSHAKS